MTEDEAIDLVLRMAGGCCENCNSDCESCKFSEARNVIIKTVATEH